MSALLERTTFETSRLLEFFSDKELALQMGTDAAHWPLALVKELLDNALDACESAGVPPEVTVTLTPDTVSVGDNGPGLPRATLDRALDYRVRVSTNAYYVSPPRGQLGNALKCLFAAPYVACNGTGAVTIATPDGTQTIRVTVDALSQEPRIICTTAPPFVKNGTTVTLHWPQIASSLLAEAEGTFYKSRALVVATLPELLQSYAAVNPHATFHLRTAGTSQSWDATDPAWRKWGPRDPTPASWYDQETWDALLAAHLVADRRQARQRTIREFLATFAGLSGTGKQKAILDATGLARQSLEALVHGDGLDHDRCQHLLHVMQQASRVIKPKDLGIIGKAHLEAMLHARGMQPASAKYQCRTGMAGPLPFVVEVASGWQMAHEVSRQVVIGLNWSPALAVPVHAVRHLLAEYRADPGDPVLLVVHIACPRVTFTDRGKGTAQLPQAITAATLEAGAACLKGWRTLKRQADRDEKVSERAMQQALAAQKRQHLSVKEAAWQVMAQAYAAASSGGSLPANARQVYYAARPLILPRIAKMEVDSVYFTQELLPDYLKAHPTETARWDVVYDARGHLREPHTGHSFGLGTLEVRRYIQQWRDPELQRPADVIIPHTVTTAGPAGRYRFALFVEKEGFDPLLAQAQIQARYDLAVMSTKGMSVTACRTLIETLTAQGVTILVLHDFDKAGLAILHTLRTSTRRYQFATRPNVVDIGLRGADVAAMGLQSEPVLYKQAEDPREYLRAVGATEEECARLVRGRDRWSGQWTGERVELNAMTSAQFLQFLEEQFDARNVTKLVPDTATLTAAYRQLHRVWQQQQTIDRALATMDPAVDVALPPMTEQQIRGLLRDDPTLSWDAALWAVIQQRDDAR